MHEESFITLDSKNIHVVHVMQHASRCLLLLRAAAYGRGAALPERSTSQLHARLCLIDPALQRNHVSQCDREKATPQGSSKALGSQIVLPFAKRFYQLLFGVRSPSCPVQYQLFV